MEYLENVEVPNSVLWAEKNQPYSFFATLGIVSFFFPPHTWFMYHYFLHLENLKKQSIHL